LNVGIEGSFGCESIDDLFEQTKWVICGPPPSGGLVAGATSFALRGLI
jgi:hypothetical protein